MTNYPKHEPHSAWILVSLSNTSRMSVKGQQANKKRELVLRDGEVSRGRQGDVLPCTRCGTSCGPLCTQLPLATGLLRHTRGRAVGRGEQRKKPHPSPTRLPGRQSTCMVRETQCSAICPWASWTFSQRQDIQGAPTRKRNFLRSKAATTVDRQRQCQRGSRAPMLQCAC